MDFDPSKENIQPLRGGRNVQQLGIALEAQHSSELQMQLKQQHEEFEKEISTYIGDDPLENWYNYISWVEQSYPKHGREGNLDSLLEHCLMMFENDKRYINDRRFCKLWIKYIDLQQKPLELYHMMKTKGICKGCADFYKAWAYYYEAIGDFQSANKVFEEGKLQLAQPYEELDIAHKNLILAAGQHTVFGPDENRLIAKRHALTSLQTYKSGRVPSVRVPSYNGPRTVPAAEGVSSDHRSNAMVFVHEDRGMDVVPVGEVVAPVSIITATRLQEAPKENQMKPGPWTTMPMKKIKSNSTHTGPNFTVHEDTDITTGGIRLPLNTPKICLEDYSGWNVMLTYPEPPNPASIPMYPKERVYNNPNTEYSPEELRAVCYLKRLIGIPRIEQAILDGVEYMQESLDELKNDIYQRTTNNHQQQTKETVTRAVQPDPPQMFQYDIRPIHTSSSAQMVVQQQEQQSCSQNNLAWAFNNRSETQQQHERMSFICNEEQEDATSSPDVKPVQNSSISQLTVRQEQQNNSSQNNVTRSFNTTKNKPQQQVERMSFISSVSQGETSSTSVDRPVHISPTSQLIVRQEQQSCSSSSSQNGLARSFSTKNESLQQHRELMSLIYRDEEEDEESSPTSTLRPVPPVNFSVFEQSSQELVLPQIQPKGSAMKSALKELNADELAETGSRGGMDVAVTAQANDCASQNRQDMDSSCTTTMFFNDLNAMRVSTPQNKRPIVSTMVSEDELGNTRKQLFTETKAVEKDKALSTILEETKSYFGSSGSSNGTTKSSISTAGQHNKLEVIPDEHNNYLQQNLSVNAALRSSLLSQIMNFDSSPVTVPKARSTICFSPIEDTSFVIPKPAVVTPFDSAPSDPFKQQLINQLLERVCFPGPHTQGYLETTNLPKLVVKKEPVYIGFDKYIIEKQLGKGTFGVVFKAVDIENHRIVALKYQKPANKWEYYICREIRSRLASHPLVSRFMDVSVGYFNDQASILVSEFLTGGSLLDLANTYKRKMGKTMKECLVIYFCIEMLKMIQALHEVKIIHADIKPDNFLVFVAPDNTVGLQLIDFGCSIDMTLFPPNSSFTRRVTTEDFVCCEMLDGRPWNYHTDLFCVAATAHVLLFDNYIKMKKQDGMWSITQRFNRYLKIDLWNMFFSSLLNQQTGPADSATLQMLLQEKLEILNKDSGTALPAQMRSVINMLKNR